MVTWWHWIVLGPALLAALYYAAVVVDDLWYANYTVPKRQERRRKRQAQRQVIARADEQHALYLAGDPRGIYGDYPPEEL